MDSLWIVWISEVYPRACGGTDLFGGPVKTLVGLSPRVRGNPRRACRIQLTPRRTGVRRRIRRTQMYIWGLLILAGAVLAIVQCVAEAV